MGSRVALRSSARCAAVMPSVPDVNPCCCRAAPSAPCPALTHLHASNHSSTDRVGTLQQLQGGGAQRSAQPALAVLLHQLEERRPQLPPAPPHRAQRISQRAGPARLRRRAWRARMRPLAAVHQSQGELRSDMAGCSCRAKGQALPPRASCLLRPLRLLLLRGPCKGGDSCKWRAAGRATAAGGSCNC